MTDFDPDKEFDPEAEISGEYMVPFVEAAGEVSPVFQKKLDKMFQRKVGNVEPDGWYRLRDVADAYHGILDQVGPKTMQQGGRAVADVLPFPEETTVREALELLQGEHADACRNTDYEIPQGRYMWELRGDRTALLGASVGYSYTQPFLRGLYDGLLSNYGPDDAQPTFTETTPPTDWRFGWEVEW